MKRGVPDQAMENALRDVAPRLAYPAPADLADRVLARVRPLTIGRKASMGFPTLRRVAVAVLVLATAVSVVLAASPAARAAVADWLGLRGVRITPLGPGQTLPVPGPISLATGGAGGALGLGEKTTLAAVAGRLLFPIQLPTLDDLAAPDEVYVNPSPVGGQVSLVYLLRTGYPAAGTTGVGVLLSEFKGRVETRFLQKVIPPGTTVEAVTVNGGPGIWIQGSPHSFFYTDDQGQVREETLRLAGNTLLWEQGGVTLRVESALDREGALRVAQSVR